MTLDTALLDFAPLFGLQPVTGPDGSEGKGPREKAVAYVATNIYSETGGAFGLNLTCVGKVRLRGSTASRARTSGRRCD